jgi:hypothetical protein
MKIVFNNNFNKTNKAASRPLRIALFALSLSLVAAAVNVMPAHAEYDPILGETTSLRSPLIPGAMALPPFVTPEPGQPPPIGDGMNPAPVVQGDSGAPFAPPSQVFIPPVGALDKQVVNSYVAPYLVPPPSTPGPDPGMIVPTQSGHKPPAELVNVNPDGGLFGNPPIQRWGGSTTRDLGLPRNYGSQTTDFGQNIDKIAKVQRFQSEDGPRPAQFPGQINSESLREVNRPGAQATQNLGFRQLFRGPNLRARTTIAPY